MALSSAVFVALILILAYGLNKLIQFRTNDPPLPPGPKGLPILGNIKDMPPPGMLECDHWLKHKDLYGPISSVTLLGQTFVIINDANLALEMLRDRAVTNSDRPKMVFSGEMIGWDRTVAFSGYNDTLKLHRKSMAKAAGSNNAFRVFDRVQEEESAHFLLRLLDAPDQLFDHIRDEAGAVILRIAYGYTPKSHEKDPLVELAGKTMQDFAEAAVPGKFLVDMLPFLRYVPDWFPGTGFKATARVMEAHLNRAAEQPFQFVKQQMREKKHKTSFLSQLLESDPKMEHIHKWTAVSLYLGGADTTVSSLMIFFLAMMVHPDVQKKAQEELDRVIGSGRLPVSADKERLPYINAILTETHRWHPVGPMGLPHVSEREDVVRGYRIPKGSLLMPNVWWFTHNPAIYPSPSTFRPERFLATPTQPAAPDPRTWTFGFGRRVCPGRAIADNALFLTIAQVLAVFSIEKVVENGEVVEPEVRFESGVVSHPVEYRACIRVRSEEYRGLMERLRGEWPWGESDAEALEGVRW